MSSEEDTELRDLVAQTLENNGVLGKIKAQLRASIFVVLQEQNSKEKDAPIVNKQLKEFLRSSEGALAINLVKEFLEYFNLEFTQSVFDPESGLDVNYNYNGRERLQDDLAVPEGKFGTGPLLAEVVRQACSASTSVKEKSIPKILTSQQVASAEIKFKDFDKNARNQLEMDEVCDVLMEIFPNFRRSLLERYVSDEFKALGKSITDAVTFDEFLAIYQQFYSLCHGVVTHDTLLFTPSVQGPPPVAVHVVDEAETDLKEIEKTNDESDLKGEGDGSPDLISENVAPPEKKELVTLNVLDRLEAEGSDIEDSFFDEPISKSTKDTFLGDATTKLGYTDDFADSMFGKENSPKDSFENAPLDRTYNFEDPPLVTTTRGGSLGSLKDAPSLVPVKDAKSPNWKDWEAIDKQIADIGLDVPDDDDYEDDFQISLSARSEHKSGTDPSAEEIEEDISGAADDLLNSSVSGVDDLTTDKTISQISGTSVDYLESFG